MSTTIQFAGDMPVSSILIINGVERKVEAFSFTPLISENALTNELVEILANELIERKVIKKLESGYVWAGSGEPLVEDYEPLQVVS